MGPKILCVAEKPSIAKAVAGHLGGGSFATRNVTGAQYTKNYDFTFNFGPPWGTCNVTMTSVLGHLTEVDFGPEFKDWRYPPPRKLLDGRVHVKVHNDKAAIARNIETQARNARILFIWTDCDREGEHIGNEVREQAVKGNSSIEVKRAKFSNIERVHVINAAKHPIELDSRQVDAVATRIELDLRIGFAFTRFQTLSLQSLGGPLGDAKISYGSCQFPTLGFVVDRYLKVQNFVPEPFWSIKVTHTRDDIDATFHWNRNRLFDRAAVTILFERCLDAKIAKITKVQQKPTKRWKPLPLTTVELQKMASRFLRMNSHTAMQVAEGLYNKGMISYPRTETDIFDKGMNLKALVEKHTQDNRWGPFAQNLVNGGFHWPRAGRNDDKAHPPIHPIAAFNADRNSDEGRLYEFVVRRFLACCSEDAIGTATDIELQYGPEAFHAHGVIVLERNFLDVYPYEKWTGNMLPKFTLGEQFEPKEATLTDGKTASPGYLTEPDLIALMDANGIGTDATMAEHIAKIKDRGYVMTQSKGGGNAPVREDIASGRGRGAGRGRGRGRGRGGGAVAESGRSSGGVEEFIPTTLGVALIEGYDNIGFEEKLSKPFLRKELELQLKAICDGTKTKNEVLRAEIGLYKRVYDQTEEEVGHLIAACRRYIFNGGVQ
ncbi:DNA topoisomerase [Pseudogymnoascus verrucosus]|uniref:DNA topoisomerase n=1 Tax=Pseudogymnoascus verrucosus TaxID=342668 RepID=A0A1B8GXM8_9PEZI|nr:DNA topoisomerase [Pseudogymnoascus verrucosus]OBU00561.1 DNA topoisomerase [Pseudogymnoascus verrucosus]